jgi:hypothetical protein
VKRPQCCTCLFNVTSFRKLTCKFCDPLAYGVHMQVMWCGRFSPSTTPATSPSGASGWLALVTLPISHVNHMLPISFVWVPVCLAKELCNLQLTSLTTTGLLLDIVGHLTTSTKVVVQQTYTLSTLSCHPLPWCPTPPCPSAACIVATEAVDQVSRVLHNVACLHICILCYLLAYLLNYQLTHLLTYPLTQSKKHGLGTTQAPRC